MTSTGSVVLSRRSRASRGFKLRREFFHLVAFNPGLGLGTRAVAKLKVLIRSHMFFPAVGTAFEQHGTVQACSQALYSVSGLRAGAAPAGAGAPAAVRAVSVVSFVSLIHGPCSTGVWLGKMP